MNLPGIRYTVCNTNLNPSYAIQTACANHITKITQSLLGIKKKKKGSLPLQLQPSVFHLNGASVTAQLTRAEPDQPAHVTPSSALLFTFGSWRAVCWEGIIWQSDKQTDRQTDKQSVGFWQRSHCQSHYHSVPLSSPTAMGQYLSRQSPSLPNIEQHAVAVFFPSDFWTHFLCFLILLRCWQDLAGRSRVSLYFSSPLSVFF